MQAILFAATIDAARSREFYENILGLTFIEDTPFALVFDVEGTMLRIQKVRQVEAPSYTSLGFTVADIVSTVNSLRSADVRCEQYDFLDQDEMGIWTTPDGAKIAWCKDPDGNVVSFTE